MNEYLYVTINDIKSIIEEVTEVVESGEIYEHGYPENRLIPTRHEEECREYTIEYTMELIKEKVIEYFECVEGWIQ